MFKFAIIRPYCRNVFDTQDFDVHSRHRTREAAYKRFDKDFRSTTGICEYRIVHIDETGAATGYVIDEW